MALSHEEKTIDLLEKILRVISLQIASDKSITERARLLKLAGLDNKTIAKVLNTTDATIRAMTSKKKS